MNKLLAVIDYQNDFVNGSLGFDGAESIDEGIAKLVKKSLAEGTKVLFTFDTHYKDYFETQEGINLPIMHCMDGSFAAELYGKTHKVYSEQFENDLIYRIKKNSYGIDPLEAVKLRDKIGENIDEITIVGVVTNICVISNAIILKSTWNNAKIRVIENLCKSFDKNLHDKALDVMKGLNIEIVKE